MEETNNDEECLIKVFACWGDEKPMQIFQLSAMGQEEYRRLLKHLELFAQFLPYLTKADKESRAKNLQHEFQLNLTLENLCTAIQLNLTQPGKEEEPNGSFSKS